MIKKISNKKVAPAKKKAISTGKANPKNVKADAEFQELLRKFVVAAETFTKPKK